MKHNIYVIAPRETPSPVDGKTTLTVINSENGLPLALFTVSVNDETGGFVPLELVTVFLGHLTEGGTRSERKIYEDSPLMTNAYGQTEVRAELPKTDTAYLRITTSDGGELTVNCNISDEVKRSVGMLPLATEGVDEFLKDEPTHLGHNPLREMDVEEHALFVAIMGFAKRLFENKKVPTDPQEAETLLRNLLIKMRTDAGTEVITAMREEMDRIAAEVTSVFKTELSRVQQQTTLEAKDDLRTALEQFTLGRIEDGRKDIEMYVTKMVRGATEEIEKRIQELKALELTREAALIAEQNKPRWWPVYVLGTLAVASAIGFVVTLVQSLSRN